MTDRRIWMYRDGEAMCFASPDDVPAEEGWTDAPGQSGKDAATIAAPVQTLQALRSRAAQLGIVFPRNAGSRRLAKLIAEVEADGR